jgi:hypothetical protein
VRRRRYEVTEMYALIDISSQMLEDSAFDMEGEIRGEATEQFAGKEGGALRDVSVISSGRRTERRRAKAPLPPPFGPRDLRRAQ